MRRAFANVLLLAAALGGGSCGNSDNARNGFIHDYCELWRPCCQMVGLREDAAECRLNLGSSAGEAFDPEAAESCLAEMRAAAADPAFCDSADVGAPSCRRVFPATGTKPAGETCSDVDECAPPPSEGDVVVCAPGSSARGDIRTCQIRRPGQAGDAPCVGTVVGPIVYGRPGLGDVPALGYLCDGADGLRCDGNGSCAPLGAPGAQCQRPVGECTPSSYCDVEAEMCVERTMPGGDCAVSEECTAETYCNPNDLTCIARLANGASCDRDDECLSARCVDGVCRPPVENAALFFVCGLPDGA